MRGGTLHGWHGPPCCTLDCRALPRWMQAGKKQQRNSRKTAANGRVRQEDLPQKNLCKQVNLCRIPASFKRTAAICAVVVRGAPNSA